jgi:hypothetical protein
LDPPTYDSCIAGITDVHHYTRGLNNYLPRLAFTNYPPNFCLPNSWDYRRELPHLAPYSNTRCYHWVTETGHTGHCVHVSPIILKWQGSEQTSNRPPLRAGCWHWCCKSLQKAWEMSRSSLKSMT